MKKAAIVLALGFCLAVRISTPVPANVVVNPYAGTFFSPSISANNVIAGQVNYADGSIQTTAYSGSFVNNVSSSTDITLQANSSADGTKYSVLFKNGANEILEAYGDRVVAYVTLNATHVSANTVTGNGSGLNALNATNIASGTIGDARLPATQTGKTFTSVSSFTGLTASAVTINGTIIGAAGISSNVVTANSFVGSVVGGSVAGTTGLFSGTLGVTGQTTMTSATINGTASSNSFFSGSGVVGVVGSSNAFFESDGTFMLTGNATAFDDLRVAPNARTTGQTTPTFLKFFTNGAGSNGTCLYAFDDASLAQEKEVFFTMQMPHAWKLGSTIHMHVHWAPLTAGTAGQLVTWGLEYNKAALGGTLGNTTITTSNTRITGDITTAGSHMLTEFPDITMAGMGVSTILTCRIYRNSSIATDTYTGTAGMLFIDAHYEVDSFGSRSEFSK